MSRRDTFIAIVGLGCVVSLPVAAHESGIYESLEHIHIGRVFLSPPERLHLDKNRNVTSPGTGESRTGVANKGAVRNDRAAGYIVSGSGRVRVWKDGDFVVTDAPSSNRFPGDVKVTRTADKIPDSDDVSTEDSVLPDVETADDAD